MALAALQAGERGDGTGSLRVVNPYSPGSLPTTLKIKLLDRSGKVLTSFERNVENGLVSGIPPVAGAAKIAAEADLYEETETRLSDARDNGIVVLPYARVTIKGFLEEPIPVGRGDARLWFRRRTDGKLIQKRAPVGPGVAVSTPLPGGDWDLVLRLPNLAPITARLTVLPGAQITQIVSRAEPGLRMTLAAVDADSKQPVPNVLIHWDMTDTPDLRDMVSARSKQRTVSLLALAINEDLPVTDASGRVPPVHLPAIPHFWTFSAEGFRTGRQAVDVKANDQEKALTLRLRSSPDLVVGVRDLGRTPARLIVDVARRSLDVEPEAPFQTFWHGDIPAGSPKRFKRIRDAEYRLDLKSDAGILQNRAWLSPANDDWLRPEISVTLTREPRTVTGRITRGDSPLEGALLFGVLDSRTSPPEDLIPPAELLMEHAARSRPDGYYTLELGGPGVYGIGYSKPDSHVDGTAGPVDLTVTTSAELNIDIPKGGLAIEVVSAKTGEAIPDASLAITLWKPDEKRGSSFTAQTDANGRYHFGPRSEGAASVTVSAPGFETKTAKLKIDSEEARPELSRIVLQPVSALRFRLADVRGLPLSGAEIWTLGDPEPADVEPPLQRLTSTDPTGLALIESPSAEPRPYFLLARGYRLDLVVAAGAQETPEIAIPLVPVEVGFPLRLRRPGGPASGSALAFLRSGVVYPWVLLGVKVKQEGLALESMLTSGADGSILVQDLLAPGQYEVFLFAPADFQARARHLFQPLGRLTLPLSTETTLMFGRDTKGGRP